MPARVITIDILKERAEINRLRREADERERWLNDTIRRAEQHQPGYVPPPFPDMFTPAIPPAPPPQGITAIVREALIAFSDKEFTGIDIENYAIERGYKLPDNDPRGRIAMVLKPLADLGELIVVEENVGRKPKRYKVRG